MTVVMLILIALGLLAALAALIYLALMARRMYRATVAAQAGLKPSLDEIAKKQQRTTELLDRIQKRQEVIVDNLESIQDTAEDLEYLSDEMTEAIDTVTGRDATGI
jgi:GTP1/Obg family GTP-binding protein